MNTVGLRRPVAYDFRGGGYIFFRGASQSLRSLRIKFDKSYHEKLHNKTPKSERIGSAEVHLLA